ncbi:MAG: hypothetical protein II696_06115, partial [Firmicutes bacterium]|nr:hypothetical protein [Bacillota bacterium]
MKKIIAIAGSFVLVIGMLALTGCGVKTDYEYDDADKYTAGDLQTSAKIEKIDIDYLAGNVDIAEVEAMGLDKVKELLKAGQKDALLDLVAQDKALEQEALSIEEVDKLLRLFHN